MRACVEATFVVLFEVVDRRLEIVLVLVFLYQFRLYREFTVHRSQSQRGPGAQVQDPFVDVDAVRRSCLGNLFSPQPRIGPLCQMARNPIQWMLFS